MFVESSILIGVCFCVLEEFNDLFMTRVRDGLLQVHGVSSSTTTSTSTTSSTALAAVASGDAVAAADVITRLFVGSLVNFIDAREVHIILFDAILC